jgi:hypothetical protein
MECRQLEWELKDRFTFNNQSIAEEVLFLQ